MYVFRTISSEVMLSALFKVTAALKFSHKSNLSHLVLLSAALCVHHRFPHLLLAGVFLQWVILNLAGQIELTLNI